MYRYMHGIWTLLHIDTLKVPLYLFTSTMFSGVNRGVPLPTIPYIKRTKIIPLRHYIIWKVEKRVL